MQRIEVEQYGMRDPRAVYDYLNRVFAGLFGNENWHNFLKRDLQDLMTLLAYALILQLGTWVIDAILSAGSLKKIIFDVVHYVLWGGTFILWLLRLYRRHAGSHFDLKGMWGANDYCVPPKELPTLSSRPMRQQLIYFLPVALATVVAQAVHVILSIPLKETLLAALGTLGITHVLISLSSDA